MYRDAERLKAFSGTVFAQCVARGPSLWPHATAFHCGVGGGCVLSIPNGRPTAGGERSTLPSDGAARRTACGAKTCATHTHALLQTPARALSLSPFVSFVCCFVSRCPPGDFFAPVGEQRTLPCHHAPLCIRGYDPAIGRMQRVSSVRHPRFPPTSQPARSRSASPCDATAPTEVSDRQKNAQMHAPHTPHAPPRMPCLPFCSLSVRIMFHPPFWFQAHGVASRARRCVLHQLCLLRACASF